MKTKTSLLKIIVKKMTIRTFAFAIASILTVSSFGQIASTSSGNEAKRNFKFTSFVVRCIEGKSYVKWTVIEPSSECLYVLERSKDNITFEPMFAKQSAKSPCDLELLCCFIDEHPLEGASYYRVRRFNKVGVVASEVVKINNYFSSAIVTTFNK